MPSSSDAFIIKLSEPSVVISTFGFDTPLTSCSFVSVLLFISTTTTVKVCSPLGTLILSSTVELLISTLVSSSSSHLYVKYES